MSSRYGNVWLNFDYLNLGRSKQRFRRFRFRSSRLGLYAQTIRRNVRWKIQNRRRQTHEQIVGWKFLQCQNEEMGQTKGRRQQTFIYNVHFGSDLQDFWYHHELQVSSFVFMTVKYHLQFLQGVNKQFVNSRIYR